VIRWGPSPSLEASRAGLERLLHRERGWPPGIGWLAVTDPTSGVALGDVLLQPAPFVDGIEIGWHFRRSAWGHGHATEAARAVADRALLTGASERLHAIVATRNARSLRVAEKVGMTRVRTQECAGLPHLLFVREAPTRAVT
jgi:RimJ/RimL family protein N-acetyltransferase